ncbi:MAG: histidine kinase [Patescibacteria group bacterium]
MSNETLNNDVIKINGNWKFYPGETKLPIAKNTAYQLKAPPSAFNNIWQTKAAGIYTLNISTENKENNHLSIYTKDLSDNVKIIVNGKMLNKHHKHIFGAYDLNRYDFYAKDNIEISLLITKSDNNYVAPIYLGKIENIANVITIETCINIIVIAIAFLIIAILIIQRYNLNREKTLVILTIFVTLNLLYFCAALANLSSWFIKNISFEYLVKFFNIWMVLNCLYLNRFLWENSKNKHEKLMLYTTILITAASLIALILPTFLSFLLFSIIIISTLTLSLLMLYDSFKRKVKSMVYLTYSTSFLICIVSLNYLWQCNVNPPAWITALCTIMFITTQMLYITDKHKQNWEKERNSALEQAYLRAQISPHFINNVLTSIVTLIDKDPGNGRAYLQKFAIYLREMFKTDQTKKQIPLIEEIELIDRYLSLEQIRYKNNMSYIIQINPEHNQVLIPPYTIQPIIENSIKHGNLAAGLPDIFTIASIKEGNYVKIQISETGEGIENKQLDVILKNQKGVGLGNVINRVKAFKGYVTFKQSPNKFCINLFLRSSK